MEIIDWAIVLALIVFGINLKLLIEDFIAYRAAKRERKPKVMIRADELAKVIAEFVNN